MLDAVRKDIWVGLKAVIPSIFSVLEVDALLHRHLILCHLFLGKKEHSVRHSLGLVFISI